MVTVKRKVNNETERYGVYASTTLEVKEPGQSFNDAQVRDAETFNYTSAAPTIKVKSPSQEEFMPKIREEHKAEEASETRKRLSSKTKVMLGVYLAVVLLISSLVIATGITLTTKAAKINDLENQVKALNDTISQQVTQMEILSDENALLGRAYENGMTKVTYAEELELLPYDDAEMYQGSTNWFDSFCDWLSGVIGG